MNRRGERSPRRNRAARRLLTAVVALCALSIWQYHQSGEVTWVSSVSRDAGQALQRAIDRVSGVFSATGVDTALEPPEHLDDFDLQGRVVRVYDGDTVSLLGPDNEQTRIRLFGIDAPEYRQPHGDAARRALAALVERRTVGVEVETTDDFGRTVGTLYLEGRNINLELVASGHAWWFRRYARGNQLLSDAESAAREAGRGLWESTDPVPPWEWRRENRR